MGDAAWIAVVLIASHTFAAYIGALLAHLDLANLASLDREAVSDRVDQVGRSSSDPEKETPPSGWNEHDRNVWRRDYHG